MPKRCTVSGTLINPELGRYFWKYTVNVQYRDCSRDAQIQELAYTGLALFTCEHCGWHAKSEIRFDELVPTLKRIIGESKR